MTRLAFVLALAPLMLAATCNTPTPTPSPGAGGADPVGGSSSSTPCAKVCARLAALGCPAAKPASDGASCVQVCADINASGTLRVDTACVILAGDCAAADRCVR
jgi:hypothetical protein